MPTGADLEAALKAHPSAGVAAPALSLEEKVEYLFAQAKAVEALVAQAGPLLAQAGPMLESLAPLLGQASSPMGRIFGSLLH
jgi:hypothetical protein